jgi:hypothetical protein
MCGRPNVMPPLATKHCTIIPPPISDETRQPVQSNSATGSEEVLNLYPIQGAARYLTVGNFASTCRSLELAEKRCQLKWSMQHHLNGESRCNYD